MQKGERGEEVTPAEHDESDEVGGGPKVEMGREVLINQMGMMPSTE